MATSGYLGSVHLQKGALFTLGLVPMIALVISMFTNPPVDPYERIAGETGEWALRFLVATLCITPIGQIFNFKRVYPFRRTLGVLCFVYAFFHALTYLVLEAGFDFSYFLDDLVERRYIIVGALAFFALVPLGLTSTNYSIKLVGCSRWKKLHKLIFPAAVFACLHFLWQTRGNPVEPLIYLGIVIALIAYRIVRARQRHNTGKTDMAAT